MYVSPVFVYWHRQASPPSPGNGNLLLHALILQALHMDSWSLTFGSNGVCLLHGSVTPHFSAGLAPASFAQGASGAESILKVAETHWPSSALQSLMPPGQLVQSPTDSTPLARGGLQSVM